MPFCDETFYRLLKSDDYRKMLKGFVQSRYLSAAELPCKPDFDEIFKSCTDEEGSCNQLEKETVNVN